VFGSRDKRSSRLTTHDLRPTQGSGATRNRIPAWHGEEGKKELDTPERFEEVLRDELSVSAEFDLPLSALALRAREGFEPEAVRRALEAVRVADLICQPIPPGCSSPCPTPGPRTPGWSRKG
jgi:hypothetical protein